MRPEKANDQDVFIRSMRENGATIVECIKATAINFSVDLGQAKVLVTSHPAWRSIADASVAFQDEVIEALDKLK